MSELQCTLEFQQVSGPLNVGDKGTLSCLGDFKGADLHSAKAVAGEDKAPAYELYLLSLKENTDQSASWIVATYKPGQYQDRKILIQAGDKLYSTAPLQWTVESVLEPGTQPEAVPSVGPIEISYPLWLWITIAVVAALVAAGGYWIWHRGERRRRLYREMDRHMSMLSAFAQFSKDMRSLTKELQAKSRSSADIIKELERVYRLYLLRELRIPALDYTTSEILKDIKKRHRRIYEGYNAPLKRVFFEFDKAKKGEIKEEDCEQMIHSCRQLADRIQAERRSS